LERSRHDLLSLHSVFMLPTILETNELQLSYHSFEIKYHPQDVKQSPVFSNVTPTDVFLHVSVSQN